jgi:hypothetical protein
MEVHMLPSQKKKKPMKRKATKAVNAAEMDYHLHEPKTVRIEKVNNGPVVRKYSEKGEEVHIAKSVNEAMRHTKKMLE